MPVSKTDQITALALEVLEDAEMSRTSVETLVLKASRLARLVGDEEAIRWLQCERLGYNNSDEVSIKYLRLTDRWIDVQTKEAYYGSTVMQESVVMAQKEQLDVAKKYMPSGDWVWYQSDAQQKRVAEIMNTMTASQRILSAVRGQIQEFATSVYYEKLFSHQVGTIFTQYQDEVDTLLAAKAKAAFNRLPQAFERLGAGDQEAISHALSTCRRVIDSFADAVYPPRPELARIGEEEIKVGARETRNRLRAYVHERIGKGSRYERINRAITSLHDRVSAGVHSDADVGEARALVLHTYLLLGEILSLPSSG
jgi:hypothetical protein